VIRSCVVKGWWTTGSVPPRTIANEVSSWLRAVGHESFLDHDLRDGISPGEDWKQRLYRELRRAF
jgi:hypothetical protein